VVVVIVIIAVLAVALLAGALLLTRSRRGDVAGEPPRAPGAGRTATAVRERPPTVAPGVDAGTIAGAEAAAVEAELTEAEAAPAADVVEVIEGDVLEDTPSGVVAEPAEAEAEAEAPVEPLVRPRLRDRLGRARALLGGALGGVRSRERIDDDTWEELEEALIRADVGVATTTELLEHLRARVKAEKVTTPAELLELLKADLVERLGTADRTLTQVPGSLDVWLFVGVNGVGKTTTIGKLAQREAGEGRRVVLGAGDTFRAAAAEQLGLWAERVGAEIIKGQEGADPASVVFDAVAAGKARDADLVLLDTAGRLHTKTNLMEELKKIRRTIDKSPGEVREVLLVIDATTGQNGLVQAVQFKDAVDITGVVLTKLDGTAKGGIVLAIQHELGIPVKVVGVGEGAADLVEFDPVEFVEALFAA
jgi:fused signal recognition particle receptor